MANIDILKKHGVRAKIARELGLNHSAPYQWRDVPANRVIAVARILSVSPSVLRPDLYPREIAPTPDSALPAVYSTQHMGD